MLTRETLLSDIDCFLARTGMKATTFGRRAVNDGKLVRRLRGHGTVSLETAAKIQEFMRAYVPSTTERAA
jgi:hypothetical protein